jgi:DNA-binding transcriptional ArsR family regulator
MGSAEEALLALGDGNRLRLLRLILERPLSVGELTRASRLGQSLVSHHLAVLARHGWIAGQPKGRKRIYRSAAELSALAPLARWIRRQVTLPDGWQPVEPQRSGVAGGRDSENDLEDYLL